MDLVLEMSYGSRVESNVYIEAISGFFFPNR